MISKSNKSVRGLLPLTLCIILLSGCFRNQANSQTSELIGVRVTVKMPIINPEKSYVDYCIFLHNLYYYGSQRAYNMCDTMRFYKGGIIEKGSETDKVDSSEIITDQWLFYSKDSINGLFYDSFYSKKPRIVKTDSCKKSFFSFSEKAFEDLNNYRLIDIEWTRDGLRKETYVAIAKPDETYSDSLLYFYDSRMNDIEFSFSKKIDNEKKMKLVRIISIYNNLSIIDKTNREFGYRFEFGIDRIPISFKNKYVIQRFEELKKGE